MWYPYDHMDAHQTHLMSDMPAWQACDSFQFGWQSQNLSFQYIVFLDEASLMKCVAIYKQWAALKTFY